MSNDLPDWLSEAADPARYNHQGVDMRELRLREMALPPDIRQNNPKLRELRDAYLGMMILDDSTKGNRIPTNVNGIQYLCLLTMRSNARAELSSVVKQLESQTTEDQKMKCKSAAKVLYKRSLEEQRRKG